MRSGSGPTGPLSDRPNDFWRAHAETETEGAGYLISEWPAALAAERLRGEWAFVQAALTRHGITTGACLDAGCGPGHWLCKLATVFDHAEGFDGAPGMVKMSSQRISAHGLENAHVVQADIREFASDRRFDFIFVGGVLTYLEDEDAARTVRKLASLLAPGGAILFRETTYRGFTRRRTEPLKPGLFGDAHAPRPPYFALYREPAEMTALLEGNGLVVRERRLNHDYKLSDFAEGALKVVDRMTRGGLARDKIRAERWAVRIHRYRALGIAPAYHLLRVLPAPIWRMQNHWFWCGAQAP